MKLCLDGTSISRNGTSFWNWSPYEFNGMSNDFCLLISGKISRTIANRSRKPGRVYGHYALYTEEDNTCSH